MRIVTPPRFTIDNLRELLAESLAHDSVAADASNPPVPSASAAYPQPSLTETVTDPWEEEW